ncbi:XdhC/CoxI family protein [Candidatus Thalassarchaeum betae]|uniref:XdhC family protein n=1 Tax=Candidatus Thalassarchaeum betae TaxID=2599289 RepID=UPI0030C775FF|nr:XdhC/CoxI family protein [Candidatus Thalassoarchaea betae]
MTRAVLTWVLERLERGESVAMASVIEASGSVPGKPGARLALTPSGARFGTIGGAGLELKVEDALRGMLNGGRQQVHEKGGRVETFVLYKDAKGEEATPLDSLCGGRVTVAMEVMDPMPHVLIAGGGHVGRAVAIVCDTLGWSHSVFDVRAEYADAERYPFASELHAGSVSGFLEGEDSDSLVRFSDVLLLGHDWAVDQEFLLGMLGRIEGGARPRIGAIGSTVKWNAFREAAVDAGVSEEAVDSVRCPIGLDIGADSPEEIAVAVCAEIMSLEKRGDSLD